MHQSNTLTTPRRYLRDTALKVIPRWDGNLGSWIPVWPALSTIYPVSIRNFLYIFRMLDYGATFFALPLSIEKSVTVCPVVVYGLMKKSRRLDLHERRT